MTVDDVIDDALAQADRLFADQMRAATTRLLAFGGEDAQPDLDVIDAALDDARRAWAIERATIPATIRRALADSETTSTPVSTARRKAAR